MKHHCKKHQPYGYTILVLVWLLLRTPLFAQQPTLVVQAGHTAPITGLAVSQDGQYALSGSRDGTIKLWELRTGKELRTFTDFARARALVKLAFSADNEYFVSAADDGNLKVWETRTGKLIQVLAEQGKAITAVCIKNNTLALGKGNGKIEIWQLPNADNNYQGQLLKTTKVHEKDVRVIQFSPNGKWLVSAGLDGKGYLWSSKNLTVQYQLVEQSTFFNAAFFTTDNKYVALGGKDSLVQVFRVSNGELFAKQQFSHSIHTLTEQSGQFIVGTKKGEVFQWDIHKATTKKVIKGIKLLRDLRSIPNSDAIVLNNRQDLQIWTTSGESLNVCQGYSPNPFADYVSTVKFSPDGHTIISSGGDKKLHFWGEPTGKQLQVGSLVNTHIFNRKGDQVISGDVDGRIIFWNMVTGDSLKVIQAHDYGVKGLALVGEQLVSVGEDQYLKIWNRTTGELQNAIKAADAALFTLAIYGDSMAVVGDGNGGIQTWNIFTGKRIRQYEGNTGIALSVLFSKDGRYIYCGTSEGYIRKWETNTGELVNAVKAHDNLVYQLSLSPDGQVLLSGSEDKTAQLQDASTLQFQATLVGHTNGVMSVDFHPKGDFWVSGGNDNTVRLWKKNTPHAIATLYDIKKEEIWAVATPQGMFDASFKAMSLIHYSIDFESIELQQLKTRYYEPDLLQKLLNYNEEPLRDIAAFNDVPLFPNITLSLKNTILTVQLKARNGGIGKVSLFLDHKELLEDANPKRQSRIKIDLAQFEKYFTPTAENIIGIKAYNSEGWLSSRLKSISYFPAITKARGKKKSEKSP